ncbi:MAG: outer membrane lipoprotein-sorting protein [Elusimicrobia bacterium]|nr:outer membrane lipoprotein-sorting protein [Elusimicrobiota bacterium]
MRQQAAMAGTFLGLCVFSWAAGKPTGQDIIQRVLDRDDGKDSYAKIEMLITDRSGMTQARSMISAVKDFGPLSKSYIRFTSPATIDGTSFLSWEVAGKDDEQFLYLSELGRDRRIASSQKDSDFVNTDFTYEDMEERDIDKDNHTLLREEKMVGYDCWVVESIPRDPKSSQYKRRVAWVPKDIYLPIRVEFYTKIVRQPTKILTVRRLEKISGIWTGKEAEMKNYDRNTATVLRTLEIKYNKGLPDRMFTRAYLKQAR